MFCLKKQPSHETLPPWGTTTSPSKTRHLSLWNLAGAPPALRTTAIKARSPPRREPDSRKTQHFRHNCFFLLLAGFFVMPTGIARIFRSFRAADADPCHRHHRRDRQPTRTRVCSTPGTTSGADPQTRRIRRSHRCPTGCSCTTGDAVSGIGLAEALDGVEVAYYLIHSMEPGSEEHFGVRERRAAENFAQAAVSGRCQADRLPGRAGAATSPRRRTWPAVWQSSASCLEAVPGLGRAARIDRDRRTLALVPIPGPPGRADAGDAHSRLGRAPHRPGRRARRDQHVSSPAADAPQVGGRSLDLAGPDVVTYQELIERIRDHLLLDRPALRLPRLTLTPIASRVSAVDRRRGARPDRSADGGSRDRPAAPARACDGRCSGSGRTHWTQRSSGRCATGKLTNRFGRAKGRAVTVPVSTMSTVHVQIEIDAPTAGRLGHRHGPEPARRVGDDPPLGQGQVAGPARAGCTDGPGSAHAGRPIQSALDAGVGDRSTRG